MERLARRKLLDPVPNSNEAWTLFPSTKQTRANWQKGWTAIFEAFQETKIWPLASTDETSACIAAFQIDWKYSNAQLMRAFDSWLNSYRPPEVAQEKSKVGGGSEIKKMRADLKALGAYRQRRSHGFSQDESQYADQSAWIKACARAEAVIMELLSNFNNSE